MTIRSMRASRPESRRRTHVSGTRNATPASGFDGVGSRGRTRGISAKSLKSEWQLDYLTAEIPYEAMRRSQKLLKSTLDKMNKTLGYMPSDEQLQNIARSLAEPYEQQVADELKSDPKLGETFFKKYMADHKQLIGQADDPFQRVLDQDPAQLRKEKVLYQDADFLVVVDIFSKKPKALVVPVKYALTPEDMTDAEFKKYADLVAKVGDELQAAVGTGAPVAWINPPQRMRLGRLHAHVGLRASTQRRRIFRPQELNDIYDNLTDALNDASN